MSEFDYLYHGTAVGLDVIAKGGLRIGGEHACLHLADSADAAKDYALDAAEDYDAYAPIVLRIKRSDLNVAQLGIDPENDSEVNEGDWEGSLGVNGNCTYGAPIPASQIELHEVLTADYEWVQDLHVLVPAHDAIHMTSDDKSSVRVEGMVLSADYQLTDAGSPETPCVRIPVANVIGDLAPEKLQIVKALIDDGVFTGVGTVSAKDVDATVDAGSSYVPAEDFDSLGAPRLGR